MPARREPKWPECARRLAEIVPKERLHPAVAAWAEASPKKQTWALGFSGGPDSLALVLLVFAHWPERRGRLVALHFNHRLRGRAAAADARFCRRVCAGLGVRLEAGEWADPPVKASETQARAARHAFFAGRLKRRLGAALWFGHQLDDVAETMLMRLARGSGAGGLSAPRPVQRFADGRLHLRPLLGLRKAEIVEALRAAGATFRVDATNAASDFLRNRLRRGVLPRWQRAEGARDVLGGVALAREILDEEDAALDAWVREIDPVLRDGSLSLARLAGKPRAVVRRALHRWLARNAGEVRLSRQAFEQLVRDVAERRETRHSLGASGFAVVGRHRMRLTVPVGKKGGRFQRRVN